MKVLRKAYHNFLTTEFARSIEPNDLLADLREADILDDEEVDLVRQQCTLPLRQYWLFVEIFACKGGGVVHIIHEILRRRGYEKAADEFFNYIPADYNAKKADVPRVTPLVEPICFALQNSAGVGAGFSSLEVETTEIQTDTVDGEEIVQQVHVRMLSSPPTRRTAGQNLSVDSVGVPARTPEEFLEEAPSFERRRPAAEEKAIDCRDVQIGEKLDRGAFAAVYVGVYKNRKVAVKEFFDYDDFSLSMFEAEVGVMKALNHKNIVVYVGYVHVPENRKLWLLTEYVPGGSMRRFCTPVRGKTSTDQTLTMRQKTMLAVGCWQGLNYLHDENLCHKDIKPENILVSNDLAQIKISDFGLAEFKNLMMTARTEISGTPMYYPPEFATHGGVIRHPVKSDIYSMGASLCELYSGQWFWNIQGTPRNSFQIMYMIMEQRSNYADKGVITDPDCWSRVPNVVQSILKDAITPDYKLRKTAREFSAAFSNLLKSLP